MHTRKNSAKRPWAWVMALLTALAFGVAPVAVAAPAFAGNADNTNDASYWSQLYGTCVKVADGNVPVPYVLGNPPAGTVWSAIIIKAGSDNAPGNYEENSVFENPEPGEYRHKTKDSISHVITCTEPKPVDVCDNIIGNQGSVPEGMVQDGEDCVTPPAVLAANPHVTSTLTCGKVDLSFTNAVELAEGETAADATFEVKVDGDVAQTVVVKANQTKTFTRSFAEDSGNHAVAVNGDPVATVASDCVTPSQEVAVLGVKIAAPTVVSSTAPQTRVLGAQLASTGTEAGVGILAGLVLLLTGTGMVLATRRRRTEDA